MYPKSLNGSAFGFNIVGFISGELTCGIVIDSGDCKLIFNCGKFGGVTACNCKFGVLLFIDFGLILALTVISALGS